MHHARERLTIDPRPRPTRRARRRNGAAFVLALAAVGGCASGAEPLPDASDAVAAKRPPPPDFATLDAEIDAILYDDWPHGDPHAYDYSPAGKRDPFRPPPDVVQPKSEKDEGPVIVSRCPSALLAGVHVDELRLEGIVRFSRGSDARATVAGPDGRGLIVDVGDRVSDECASVAAILDESLVLAVPQRTQRGQEAQARRILRLRTASDDAPTRE